MNLPDFSFEQKAWAAGFELVAGVDEVGRGSFAGPVVAAAVAFAPITNFQFTISNQLINDSKKLNEKQRVLAAKWIKKNSLAWGIGSTSVSIINKIGIGKATNMAFRRAISSVNQKIKSRVNYLLIDAFYIPHIRGLRRKHQQAIIKGDSLSFSIAAASIIAKVARDNYMTKLSQKMDYEKYQWHANKGYGTRNHREMILKYGTTRHHRKQFVKSCLLVS